MPSSDASQGDNAENQEFPEVTLEEALELAQGHHKIGNFILAERTYRDILRAVPNHYPTTEYLGILLYQSGNHLDSLHFMGLALEAEPENPQCLNNYGGILAQLGQYEEALEYYDKALNAKPDYVDALNNKAVALWTQDEFKQAEELHRKALEIDPDNYAALNGLALVLAKRVKFEEAIDYLEKASELYPEEATIWVNWGNILREMGRLKESEEKCRKAIEVDPKNPEALNNLANVLRDEGQVDEAIEIYTQATDERPESFESHVNKAIAYSDNGDYGDAAIAARYAVAFNRDSAEGYSVLSRSLCELGEFDQAHMAAQRAIHLAPDDAQPYIDLACVLTYMDQNDDAEAAIHEALKREPDHARTYIRLSEIRETRQDFEGAYEAIDRALGLSENMPMAWTRKGMLHSQDGRAEESLEYLDKAIEIAPDWHVARVHKAEVLVSLNRNDDAKQEILDVLEMKKNIPSAYSTLVSIKAIKDKDDPLFEDMMALEDGIEKYGQIPACAFMYTLSDFFEQMKEYDRAFEYLEKAGEIKKRLIHYSGDENPIFSAENLKKRYRKEFFEGHMGKDFGCDSEVPVFIVGMPRSGTTLTEQIISSHPSVYGAGELADLGAVVKDAPDVIKPEDLEKIGRDYVERIQARDREGGSLRITDKMPGNYGNMGLIAVALPKAKIIHCRRNPIDTSLSCLKQNFARGQYWSYDLETLADEYEKYLQIMQHWRETIPDRFIEVDYEETVNNFEEQARRLIDYVGLEWDDACLEPHKQKRTVLTASKAQVTQKVYKTSVDKWKRYEWQLQPLVKRLLPDQAMSDADYEKALADAEKAKAERDKPAKKKKAKK